MTVRTRRLERKLRRQASQGFQRAAVEIVKEAKGAGRPRDTGRLLDGIQVRGRSLGGDALRVTVTSTARSDQGFDYPSFLNETRRVAPTRAKYLRFQVGGQWVTSSGFANRHKGFWDQPGRGFFTEQTWLGHLRRQLDRAFR